MKVYMLLEHGGDYDTAYTSIIAVSVKGPAALEALAENKRLQQVEDEVLIKEYFADFEAWRKQNPIPQIDMATLDRYRVTPWPSVRGVKQIITQEMRDQRSREQAMYDSMRAQLMAPAVEWQNRCTELQSAWWSSRGRAAPTNFDCNCTWEVVEHETID